MKATQNQNSFSGGIALVRAVPSLAGQSRVTALLPDSPARTEKSPSPLTLRGVTVPAVVTKSAIFHIEGERDHDLSPRIFALVQTAFDYRLSPQDLQLQQDPDGGGLGWTLLKSEKQEADVKGTIQYEKQKFISSAT